MLVISILPFSCLLLKEPPQSHSKTEDSERNTIDAPEAESNASSSLMDDVSYVRSGSGSDSEEEDTNELLLLDEIACGRRWNVANH